MKLQQVLTWLAVLAFGACEAAETGLVPLIWTSEGRFAKELSVPAAEFVEVCGHLPSGAQVHWSFESAIPMGFNIHYHEGEEARFPERRESASDARGTLQTTVEQDYCWMWTNKSKNPASLRVQLTRG